MAFRSPYGSPGIQIDTDVPSFVPQIADLGAMMDHYTQRRMQLAQMQEKERSDREKDLYYRGRNAAADKRNATLDLAARTKHNADTLKQVRSAPGAGPVMMFDKSGQPAMYSPEFDPGNGDEPAILPDQQPGSQSMDDVLAGFGRAPGTMPTVPPPAPEPQATVTSVPPSRTRGDFYDLSNPARDDLAERGRNMSRQQREDLDVANRALERGEAGAGPTSHNKEWADFYGRNASSRDFDAMQKDYEAQKAAQRGREPQAEVLAVQPTIAEGDFHDLRRAAPGGTMFYDENNDGDVQSLTGPNDEQVVNLPQDAYPTGAREGDRFDRNDVGEGGRKGNPFAEPTVPRATNDTVFYDEPEEDYVQALMGPNDEQVTQLPQDAFPPGAREGQRFDRNDVGEGGRKGNPFAEPLPMGPQANAFVDQIDEDEARVLQGDDPRLHDVPTDRLPPGAREGQTYRGEDVGLGAGRMNPQAQPVQASPGGSVGVTRVPPTVAEGDFHRLPEQGQNSVRGPRWIYKAPGQEPIVVDISQMRAAKEAEAQDRIGRMQQQYENELNPANRMWLAQKIAEERMMLGEGAGREMRQNYSRVENREDTQEFQAGESQKNRDARSVDTDKRLATQEKVAAMRKRKGKGGGTAAQSSGPGSAFSRLKPMEQARVESSVNTGIGMLDRQMNWNQLEGKGFDRLDLALENIRSKGKLGGAAQMEAMMNFFGYIRGGVPAKNETDEFKQVTGTLWTWLEKMGMKLGGSGWEPSDGDRTAFANSLGQLPEAQRAGLEQAIRQSQGVLHKVAIKNVGSQIEAYKSAGPAFHERAQDKINAKLRFIGMPARQWFSDSPLIPDFDADASGSGPPAPDGAGRASGTAPRGGGGLEALIRSLP
jgi:hypothetical protein